MAAFIQSSPINCPGYCQHNHFWFRANDRILALSRLVLSFKWRLMFDENWDVIATGHFSTSRSLSLDSLCENCLAYSEFRKSGEVLHQKNNHRIFGKT
jgi:hypothetical protein